MTDDNEATPDRLLVDGRATVGGSGWKIEVWQLWLPGKTGATALPRPEVPSVETFLEEVAQTAEEVAAEQHQVARQARSLQRARDRGTPWSELLDRNGAGFGLLGRLRDSGRKLGTTTARLSQGLAEQLRSEGHSHRAIAHCLGVTHQRISAMLNRGTNPGGPQS